MYYTLTCTQSRYCSQILPQFRSISSAFCFENAERCSGVADAAVAGSRYPSNQALKQESYSFLRDVHFGDRLLAISSDMKASQTTINHKLRVSDAHHYGSRPRYWRSPHPTPRP